MKAPTQGGRRPTGGGAFNELTLGEFRRGLQAQRSAARAISNVAGLRALTVFPYHLLSRAAARQAKEAAEESGYPGK